MQTATNQAASPSHSAIHAAPPWKEVENPRLENRKKKRKKNQSAMSCPCPPTPQIDNSRSQSGKSVGTGPMTDLIPGNQLHRTTTKSPLPLRRPYRRAHRPPEKSEEKNRSRYESGPAAASLIPCRNVSAILERLVAGASSAGVVASVSVCCSSAGTTSSS